MTNIYEGLPPYSFAGIEFPAMDVRVAAGGRSHRHEYPHAPGGVAEKLGRKIVEVSLKIPMHDGFPRFPGLFSRTLPRLRAEMQAQSTADLTVPHLGTFRAFIDRWDEQASFLSGVDVDVTFVEDSVASFLVDELIATETRSLAEVGTRFLFWADELRQRDGDEVFGLELEDRGRASGVFESMRALTGFFGAVGDTFDLYSSFYELKLSELLGYCALVDRAFSPVDDARNHRLLEALHELWARTQELSRNLRAAAPQIDVYITPRRMTVAQVALEVYGDGARGADVIGLNVGSIADPFAIPLGTRLRYFRAATTAST